jgi:hypothetical protein
MRAVLAFILALLLTTPALAQAIGPPGGSGGSGSAITSLTGDCTGTGPGATATSCTKTGGVAFAPSATTDTTNASNITSGTLPCAQVAIGGTCILTITVANVANTGDVGSVAVPAIGDFVAAGAGVDPGAWLRNCSAGATGAITAAVRTAATGGGTALYAFAANTPPASGSVTRGSGATASTFLGNSATTTTLYFNETVTTATGSCSVDVALQRTN